MKEISKIATAALPLMLMGSSVFSQSLDDAKKAIDAEQYQKAKSMLKNLTQTQADKDENYFYLGWVYILQDYPDSAKAVFTQGIAKNAKSALNYAGLGAVARLEKNAAGATTNFNQAVSLAGKSSTPYLYVGEAYLLDPADAKAAADVLAKGKAVNPKDAALLVELGNANRLLVKSSEALTNYQEALTADPKAASAIVAKGVLWRYANNFEQSETEYKAALAINPNYGPAYREWAETDLRWAFNDPKMASAKVKEGVENYKKYLSLTDRSVESRMRYADFLLAAGDYPTLQAEVAELEKVAGANNLKIYRYKAYAAYENKDYTAALAGMKKFMAEAGEKRIIPRDYLYLGRIQVAMGDDSTGINSLRKAVELDTTQVDLYADIAKTLYQKKKYAEAGEAYSKYIEKSRGAKLNDYLSMGLSYYFAFQDQYFSTAKPKPTADPALLTKADSAFSYIQAKSTTPIPIVALYRARVNDYKETNRDNITGIAKPYYEQYIQIVTAKGAPAEADKKGLAEAYSYLGSLYEFKDKDEVKAAENYTKARELDPANKQAQRFFAKKGGAKGK
ncbi:hypothetical protein LJ707_10755 [Mucilaginibacter sp. UR6-1]|uniref:tetratricopeptide repeat protein n=1 Tax=Mucilaginibacter sp. UR6-1 TaxID=1435643 RepID=UPI001E5811A4|nr:hypothetical protein [Mucilaginibacter sp. UR6-1]MCC8409413.1 hypothetical protein [Mucilaginibacter sp. UR6-1]